MREKRAHSGDGGGHASRAWRGKKGKAQGKQRWPRSARTPRNDAAKGWGQKPPAPHGQTPPNDAAFGRPASRRGLCAPSAVGRQRGTGMKRRPKNAIAQWKCKASSRQCPEIQDNNRPQTCFAKLNRARPHSSANLASGLGAVARGRLSQYFRRIRRLGRPGKRQASKAKGRRGGHGHQTNVPPPFLPSQCVKTLARPHWPTAKPDPFPGTAANQRSQRPFTPNTKMPFGPSTLFGKRVHPGGELAFWATGHRRLPIPVSVFVGRSNAPPRRFAPHRPHSEGHVAESDSWHEERFSMRGKGLGTGFRARGLGGSCFGKGARKCTRTLCLAFPCGGRASKPLCIHNRAREQVGVSGSPFAHKRPKAVWPILASEASHSTIQSSRVR
ncbi:hypothetical protein, conserved in T. vivax [Trypanosoma vivax Y486]|uniref:Uncharacterized protein n=1 Tax=Trypanosoma vivax (strain Y486) TaxID=1055687 RepID=F9WKC6_TRYVY|nr:hypothetical protein, conserved in T. vivax [Trypanosoma vivax Y486]|eukprot:CCD17946.1 hypothetical protein, conserved in T. vivax [Trypanosoma vivax Y486]